jgi:hypothetical protein
MRLRGFFAACACAIAACHSPGPYGHAVNYAPTDDEARAADGAREYDPVMYPREPDAWRKGAVHLFGVVESRSPGPGGAAMLKLSVRRLEPRNLCENERDEDSCKVTVSDKDFGVVYALLTLRGDDDVGPRAIAPRSLVRIIGSIGQDPSPTDGAPVVRATFMRHWPAHTYALKSFAPDLRQ